MAEPIATGIAFVREACAGTEVWTIWDGGGLPTAMTRQGETAIPFWSSEWRAWAFIESAAQYGEYHPRNVPLLVFLDELLPAFDSHGLRVGTNWEAPGAVGHDANAAGVAAAIRALKDAGIG
ncbi:DUF2750 domain-containing protein [Sphingomonas sp. ST-64]|uniref:DUF2750 domain-containing protein n=1 Tax=Sphingomonas plantiphila TaxID=3163295 RepID=A0ABW8YHX5_9SPHN